MAVWKNSLASSHCIHLLFMLKNYFLVAWRQLLKNRQFTILNLLGLSTGLACTLLIVLWVQDERSVDRFHEHTAQLYQVMENRPLNKEIITAQGTSPQLAAALPAVLPAVKYAAVTTPANWFPGVVLSVGEDKIKGAGLFASKDYLQVFTWPLTSGNKEQALAGKEGIVLSEQLARRLFHGTGQVIGQVVHWQIDQIRKSSVVTGVFKGTPANSSVQFDFLLPFDQFREIMNIGEGMSTGGPFHTYLVLQEGAPVPAFNKKLSAYMQRHSQGQERRLFLSPYGDNYLHGQYENGVATGGRIAYVQLFSLIACCILAMACINFINLSTAKTAGRLKEIGIRKTMGARRLSLIMQYLTESFLLVLVSLLLALGMTAVLLPFFNGITGKVLALSFNASLWGTLAAIAMVTTLLAGSYPAFYLSGFRPVAVLKKALPGLSAGSLWARRGLVVVQFSLSVIFTVAVIVVYKQIDYIQSRPPGYDKDQVLYFEMEGRIPGSMEAFVGQVKQLPGVANAAGMTGNVLGGPTNGNQVMLNGRTDTIPFRPFLVNYGMIETLGITMKEGRTFSPAYGLDTGKVIFNEAAIQLLGIKDPVGKLIKMDGVDKEIIGVAANFHFQSLHETIKPLFFKLDKQNTTIMVKLRAGQERAAISALQTFYKNYNPGYSLDYRFLDADYQAQYSGEQRVAALSRYFAALALLISCLGLFGLAAFTTEKRRKEIGIRKVLGATARQLVSLLSKEYLRTVAIALAIAIPVSGWIMHQWLDGFAWHIPLTMDIFLATGTMVLFLTLLTVSMQAIRVAIANPVKNLDLE